jgi:hypothetical protein
MDLSSLDTVAAASEGAVMPVRHPVTKVALKTEKGEAVTLTVTGSDSKEFRDQERALINKRINAGQRTANADDIYSEATAVLASCVKAWANIELDGKKLDCTPANVKTVLTRFPWLREQVDAFVGDRANFLQA